MTQKLLWRILVSKMGPPSETCPLLGHSQSQQIFSDFFEVGNGDYRLSRVMILFSLPGTYCMDCPKHCVLHNYIIYQVLFFCGHSFLHVHACFLITFKMQNAPYTWNQLHNSLLTCYLLTYGFLSKELYSDTICIVPSTKGYCGTNSVLLY